jgi:3'-phosphoadenosine 5'-phosphosulfate sulfotransferase (PAPS reductase)/FAD synthetase
MSTTIPDAVDATAARSARRVLARTPTDGEVLALVSGGHDSLSAMAIVRGSSRVDLSGIVHVNTGIGIPQTRAFVRQRTRKLEIPYYEVGATCDEPGQVNEYRRPHEEYPVLIRKYGFPGPGAHKYMYWNLKQKPLQRFLNERPDPITLVSGVRRGESDRRMENVDEEGISEYLGYPTISPLVDFTGLDVRRYRSALNLPMNPVTERLEMSGECLCGAFATRGELRIIRLFYPRVYRRILCLEAMVGAHTATEDGPKKTYGEWGHNRLKDREQAARQDDQQMLLCDSCESSCRGKESRDCE